MKEIRETKLVEQTTVKFVADNGKEFIGENAERDCKRYERQCDEDRVIRVFEKLDSKFLSIPFIEQFYGNEASLIAVKLNSKADYIALVDYLEVCNNGWDTRIIEPTEYPCNKIITKGCEWAYDYNGDLEENLRQTLNQLTEFLN